MVILQYTAQNERHLGVKIGGVFMKKQILLAIRLGLTFGMITCLTFGIPYILRQGYLSGQLYCISATYLISRANEFLPITIASSLLILLMYHVGCLQNERVKPWFNSVTILFVLAYTLTRLGYWGLICTIIKHSDNPGIVQLRRTIACMLSDVQNNASQDFI